MFSNIENFKTTLDMSRLWVHEVTRVYGDKLVNSDVRVFVLKFIT